MQQISTYFNSKRVDLKAKNIYQSDFCITNLKLQKPAIAHFHETTLDVIHKLKVHNGLIHI